MLGTAYPSQVRAARGRSPASREGADQQPSLGGVSGSAGAGGKRAPGVLLPAQPLHGRSSLGSGAPVAAATAAWNAEAASKTHASQHAASGSEPPVRSGGSGASSGALSFYHNHERSNYAVAPPPFSRASLGCTPATSRLRQRSPTVKSFQLLLADPLDGPAGRHKAMPPARSRCG